jgi:chaperone required for assembly of F1-ATPase
MSQDPKNDLPKALLDDLLPTHGEAIDPHEMARRDQRKTLPKRFYTQAHFDLRDGAHALLLDGKPAKTPGRKPLALPTQDAARMVADEWQAQAGQIDPATMPVTRIVNSALDGVANEIDAVRDEIVKYAGSDLVCYRAAEPEGLVQSQALLWDPVLDFARDDLGAHFVLAQGILFVDQPDHAIAAVRRAVEEVDGAIALACLHVMTTLTGSALIALAVARGQISVEAAWAATHADEDFQIRIWGTDAEALARRERRWTEMKSAADLLAAVRVA